MSVSKFISYTTTIQSYLSQINTENANIQSGKNTPFDNMPTYLNKVITFCDMAKSELLVTYLSSAQLTQYSAGALTIDEVVGFELFSYYNTLQKLRLYAFGSLGMITSTPKQGFISFYANSDDYTLTTEQFDETGANKVLNESTFEYYTIQQGDTARIIASRMLGDPEKYVSILKINNITETQLIQNSLVGTRIKIPVSVGAVVQNSENLVFEPDFTAIDKFIHGSSIDVGINNTIAISATGDILGVSGVGVTYNSVMARLGISKGELNVFSPNFGVQNIGDGNEPLMVRIDRFITDFTNQIQEDPRVASVQVDMKSIKLVGEVLSLKAIIAFVGTEEKKEVSI